MFATVGAFGHLYPVVPLALAARGLGHEVVVATDSQFHAALHSVGLETLAAGLTVEAALAGAAADLDSGVADEADIAVQAFGRVLPRRTAADLRSALESGKFDLVIHEVGNPGAGIAARIAGVPSVAMGLGRLPEGPLWELMFPALTAISAEFGIEIHDPRTLDSPYIDICPPSLQVPGFAKSVTHIPTRPVAWNPPAALPRAVFDTSRTRPLVYLTLGTAFAHVDLLRQMIAALAALPVDALMATGPGVPISDVGELPGNVTVEQWVPQADVLRHVNLVVHHGGSGTFLGALANGLPQLLLPMGADQFTNGQIIVAARGGRQILPGEVTAEAIAENIRALLADGEARDAAEKIAAEIAAMPSAEQAMRQLIKLMS